MLLPENRGIIMKRRVPGPWKEGLVLKRWSAFALAALLLFSALPIRADTVGKAWRMAALYVPASAMPESMQETEEDDSGDDYENEEGEEPDSEDMQSGENESASDEAEN